MTTLYCKSESFRNMETTYIDDEVFYKQYQTNRTSILNTLSAVLESMLGQLVYSVIYLYPVLGPLSSNATTCNLVGDEQSFAFGILKSRIAQFSIKLDNLSGQSLNLSKVSWALKYLFLKSQSRPLNVILLRAAPNSTSLPLSSLFCKLKITTRK